MTKQATSKPSSWRDHCFTAFDFQHMRFPKTEVDPIAKSALAKKYWKTSRVLFSNKQWAVTTYGVENVRGPGHYAIAKSDLIIPMGEYRTWCDHMAEKNWVIPDLFNEAYEQALVIHGDQR